MTPSSDTVQSGEYAPLSRPLFIYPNADALKKDFAPAALAALRFSASAVAAASP